MTECAWSEPTHFVSGGKLNIVILIKILKTRDVMLTQINIYPANIYLFKGINRNTRKKVWNIFKVNNKNTRTMSMMSFWYFYC